MRGFFFLLALTPKTVCVCVCVICPSISSTSVAQVFTVCFPTATSRFPATLVHLVTHIVGQAASGLDVSVEVVDTAVLLDAISLMP